MPAAPQFLYDVRRQARALRCPQTCQTLRRLAQMWLESPHPETNERREKGLARAGNARVRRGLIQLAWRFLVFQKDSALARWYRTRTEGPSGARKTTMIVALARKLLIALWRLVTTGEVPDGVALRPAA